MQHAHERGLVHRDVQPHNLMVTRQGQVKVLDFGLARLAREAGPATTEVGTALATPGFLAPEQVGDSRRVDGRADVYSLGATLYFLLAGHPPFPEGSAVEKALAHVGPRPAPGTARRGDVPAELAAVLERMMANDPDQRYQTPAEAAEALAPFAPVGGPAAATRPPSGGRRRWLGLLLVALALLLAGLLLGGGALSFFSSRRR